MQLLDRYLQAVKFWLPKAQQDDITAELSANLHAQIDDREAELGRALTSAEIAAILKQLGAPIFVASRYRQDHHTVAFRRQLIGPLVFPFYWTAMKVTLVLLPYSGHHSRAGLKFSGSSLARPAPRRSAAAAIRLSRIPCRYAHLRVLRLLPAQIPPHRKME